MKKQFFIKLFTFFLLFSVKQISAQSQFGSSVEYLNSISSVLDRVQADQWKYANAVSHGRSARKVEKRRNEIIISMEEAQDYMSKLPDYKGDKSLRDSVLSYLKLNYSILKNDYGKIVSLEEASEQSYDNMQLYLAAQQSVYAKQDSSIKMLNDEVKEFAAKYNVVLHDSKAQIKQKLEESSLAMDYYNKMYLQFFKMYKQETYLMEALNKANVAGMNQYTDSLKFFCNTVIGNLDTMQRYKTDGSLKLACRVMAQFYKRETEIQMPKIMKYFLAKEKLDTVKKSYDAKPAASRTAVDVDVYNKAVGEYNSAIQQYNAVNIDLNDGRTKAIGEWNTAVNTFIETYVPKND